MIRKFKSYFSLFDLRYYWLFLAIIILYAFVGTFNTPEYIFPVLCAFLSAGIVLALVRYQWTSFISIFVLGHIVQYPLAALIILSLSRSDLSIEPELWTVTPAAMWAMVVGMAGLAVGLLLSGADKAKSRIRNVKNAKKWVTPVSFNVMLTMLIIPLAYSYMSLGFYYHKDVVLDYNVAASETFGFLGYLQYISLAGILLQLRRYTITNQRRDLYYLGFLLLLTFATQAPSGSRRGALFAFVVTAICYFEWNNNEKRKIILFLAGSSFFMLMLPILEMYRGIGVAGANSFLERLSIMSKYIFTLQATDTDSRSLEIFFSMLGRRLSDYISVGFVIDVVPSRFPYSGFGDVGQWFYYILPTLMRPEVNLPYTYDAVIMENYGMRPIAVTGGSSPLMIIGDLYNRSGWSGIFFGMIIIGLILSKLDRRLRDGSFIGIVIWVLLMDSIVNLHSQTLLKFFTMMTRHILIYIAIAALLEISLRALEIIGSGYKKIIPPDNALISNRSCKNG